MSQKGKRIPNVMLLRVGSWSIERSWEEPSGGTFRPAWFHNNEHSIIKHECPGKHTVASVYVWAMKEKLCWRCGEGIPEGVKGAWTLHNWEAIQNGR